MELCNIRKAETFARIAHYGQFRKAKDVENHPYIEHLINVKNLVKRFGGSREDQVVALLHDVIEDGAKKGFNNEMIKRFFGEGVAERVEAVTNKKVDPDTKRLLHKDEWKARKQEIQILMVSKMSVGDQLIKACDQIDNIADFVGLEPDSSLEYRRRYLAKGFAVIAACDKIPEAIKSYAKVLKNKTDYIMDLEDLEDKGLFVARGKFRKEWIAANR